MSVPDLHSALLPVSFLLGTWRGEGVGGYPTIEDFRFGQEVTFRHAGKPVLGYTSRSWSLVGGPGPGERGELAGECGYWRPVSAGQLEVVLSHGGGITEVWLGTVAGARIEIATDVVARTPSAKEVTAGHRLYGMVDGDLLYAYDMAAVGQPLQPHVSARLTRVGA